MENLTAKDFEYIESCFSGNPETGEITTINITPELVELLNGRCFIDLDMPDRLEAFQFKKTFNGINAIYCGTDGAGVAYINYSECEADLCGEHNIDDTYNGASIECIITKPAFSVEIPYAAFEHILAHVHKQKTIVEANRQYINEVRSVILKHSANHRQS